MLKTLVLRRVFLTLCTVGFLWLHMSEPVHLISLALFILSGYAAARVLARYPNTAGLATYVTLLIVAFVLLKKYAFLRLFAGDTLLSHTIDLVGLSFIFFRQIHYVVDSKQGEITDRSLWSYLVYQLNPFTLLAGPIQRFQRFNEDWQSLKPLHSGGVELRMHILRILIGVFKVALIAELCLWLPTSMPDPDSGLAKIVEFYAFPAYVFFNFTGYCDIVISGAALVGLRVPENFDRPYLARNMIDYWTRWHRTLTFWIRDYLFTPLYMAIARRWTRWAPHLAFLCYFVALFLAGVWHGATWNFVIFGLLNGLGVSAAKLWENFIIARRGRKGLREYLASKPILYTVRFTNFHFVCLTMFFLKIESTDTLMYYLGRVIALVM